MGFLLEMEKIREFWKVFGFSEIGVGRIVAMRFGFGFMGVVDFVIF